MTTCLDKALYSACCDGNLDAVMRALGAGADVNANVTDYSPLHQAATSGNVLCVKLLIDAGADIEARSLFGCTPLRQAAMEGHVACVELLIKAGADVDAKSAFVDTPLRCAAENRSEACCVVLIDAGAEFESIRIGREAQLLLSFAKENKWSGVVASIERRLMLAPTPPSKSASAIEDGLGL